MFDKISDKYRYGKIVDWLSTDIIIFTFHSTLAQSLSSELLIYSTQ